jgi:surface polysaccharide O-acyltransferase-like enzyme
VDPKAGNLSLPVDLIRTFAIVLVVVLHAASEQVSVASQMSPQGVALWWTANIYNSLSRPAVPLFVMLSGALLLQPAKFGEPLKVFFKKRLNRIAVPFLFWSAAYFVWRAFVNGEVLSAGSIFQGLLSGPYVHFWFLYMIFGLYLLTPVLRVVVAHVDRSVFSFFMVLWFLGTGVVPLFNIFSPVNFNADIFLFIGWVGYFLLGTYVLKMHVRSDALLLLLAGGFAWTIVGTYLLVGTKGELYSHFFYNVYSFSMIASSFALFLLLAAVPANALETRFPRGNRLLRVISVNTLPIYLFHVMVMDALQNGYFGFQISLATMNPALEVPLISVLTLIITLGVIVPLKKIPILKRLIG